MLLSLAVKNFAIIDNLKIDFNNSMTVLTGETGTGKSLIIDAISLLLGGKADLSLIRHGEQKALIEGVFSYEENLVTYFQDHGLHNEEDVLIIRREILSSGKSSARVNGTLVSLAELSELGELLGDIHSQNDTLGLVNPKNYLSFLTNEKINNYLNLYKASLKTYKLVKREYDNLVKKINEAKEKEEFIKFQVKDLQHANLSLVEELNLREELNYLSSYEIRIKALKEFHSKMDDALVLDNLYLAIQALNRLEKIDQQYESLNKAFLEKYYELESLCAEPKLKLTSIDYDEGRIEEINNRLAVYSDLRRKYKKDTKELLAFYEELKTSLGQLDNSEEYLSQMKIKLDEAYQETYSYAVLISEQRKEQALILEAALAEQFSDLELKNTSFKIIFKETQNVFLSDGIDEIDFLVSFNKGEPQKPFVKVASGGEMSRFMLALKSTIANKYPLQFKVFDEIDHGVSGLVAYRIAEKMKAIAVSSQVLCITHLPQVASISKYHLKIKKVITQGRTITALEELAGEARVNEIAAMIAKGIPTAASINLARELLTTKEN